MSVLSPLPRCFAAAAQGHRCPPTVSSLSTGTCPSCLSSATYSHPAVPVLGRSGAVLSPGLCETFTQRMVSLGLGTAGCHGPWARRANHAALPRLADSNHTTIRKEKSRVID